MEKTSEQIYDEIELEAHLKTRERLASGLVRELGPNLSQVLSMYAMTPRGLVPVWDLLMFDKWCQISRLN